MIRRRFTLTQLRPFFSQVVRYFGVCGTRMHGSSLHSNVLKAGRRGQPSISVVDVVLHPNALAFKVEDHPPVRLSDTKIGRLARLSEDVPLYLSSGFPGRERWIATPEPQVGALK